MNLQVAVYRYPILTLECALASSVEKDIFFLILVFVWSFYIVLCDLDVEKYLQCSILTKQIVRTVCVTSDQGRARSEPWYQISIICEYLHTSYGSYQTGPWRAVDPHYLMLMLDKQRECSEVETTIKQIYNRLNESKMLRNISTKNILRNKRSEECWN